MNKRLEGERVQVTQASDSCARPCARCPKSVDFMDRLPRLPTGKLYKKPLRDKYWAGKKSRIV